MHLLHGFDLIKEIERNPLPELKPGKDGNPKLLEWLRKNPCTLCGLMGHAWFNCIVSGSKVLKVGQMKKYDKYKEINKLMLLDYNRLLKNLMSWHTICVRNMEEEAGVCIDRIDFGVGEKCDNLLITFFMYLDWFP